MSGAGAFVVTSEGEAVGWSAWPWGGGYAPVVGLFREGALVAAAACELTPGATGPAPSSAFHARVARRAFHALGRRPAPPRPPLDGPDAPVWFRMALDPDAAARLRVGATGVRLERLEDGEGLRRADAPAPAPDAPGPRTVESLLEPPPPDRTTPLDGYEAFLRAPALHRMEVVFFEYLRRLPEDGARDAYLPRMEAGDLDALGLRRILLASDEFRARRIGHGARLGASLTSPLWRRFAELPSLLPPRAGGDALPPGRA